MGSLDISYVRDAAEGASIRLKIATGFTLDRRTKFYRANRWQFTESLSHAIKSGAQV